MDASILYIKAGTAGEYMRPSVNTRRRVNVELLGVQLMFAVTGHKCNPINTQPSTALALAP